MTEDLPQYLERPRHTGQTFGILRRVVYRGAPFWELTGDPQVILLAKRLFPGSSGHGRGIARFPANRRSFADLVWFQQRWPLRVEKPDDWEAAYRETCAHARERAAINRLPRSAMPAAIFRGQLKPFQQEGLAWLMVNRRTLLADEMGLGKTVQAIAFLGTAAPWPELIVPPAHLVRHWQAKLSEFLAVAQAGELALAGNLPVHTIRGIRSYNLPSANIYLCHYLLLAHWREPLKELGLRAIVFDEIQELCHGGTAKYSAASDLASRTDAVLGLSGTPIYNRGAEIWSVTNAIEYHCLGDRDSFTREWCTGYGSDTVQDPAVLGAHLRREGLMLRRRKEDVLAELPPKRRCLQIVDSDEGLFASLVQGAAALAVKASQTGDVLERGRLEREAVNQTRRATGLAKLTAVSHFVRGLLVSGEPTMVFAHHHDVVDGLVGQLREYHPTCITGRESATEKWNSQQAFQEGRTNLCIISLRAAAGLDGFQARARVVVFAELDWSPAVHSQAEDRAHRDGQRDSVLAYYLVSDCGTDPDVREALGLKVGQFTALMGDEPETEEDRALAARDTSRHMRHILERLRALVSRPDREAQHQPHVNLQGEGLT